MIYFELALKTLVLLDVMKLPAISKLALVVTVPELLFIMTLPSLFAPVNEPDIVCVPVPVKIMEEVEEIFNVPLFVKLPHTVSVTPALIVRVALELTVRSFTDASAEITG